MYAEVIFESKTFHSNALLGGHYIGVKVEARRFIAALALSRNSLDR